MTFQFPDIAEKPMGAMRPRGVLSDAEAKKNALQRIRDNSVPPLQISVLQLLATCGAMTVNQLNRSLAVSSRTLARMREEQLLDAYRVLEELKRVGGVGSTNEDLRVYMLGKVGELYARESDWTVQEGYSGYGMTRLAHDILCNEVCLRLAAAGKERGYVVNWLSKGQASVTNIDGVKCLEPDSIIVFSRPGSQDQLAFAVELHNELSTQRGMEKISKYEGVFLEGRWHSEWNGLIREFPAVLAVYTHSGTPSGYLKGIEEWARTKVKVRYYGKQWADVVQNRPGWVDFVHLFDIMTVAKEDPKKAQQMDPPEIESLFPDSADRHPDYHQSLAAPGAVMMEAPRVIHDPDREKRQEVSRKALAARRAKRNGAKDAVTKQRVDGFSSLEMEQE